MSGPSRPLRIALTGGIASGKSTVAELFRQHGAPIIDTDVIARELVEPGQPAVAEIRAAFGADIVDSAGRLDRSKLRARIFADASERRRLETILHPRILQVVERRSLSSDAPYAIVVVPLLVEAGLVDAFDRILVVDCPADVQIERLMDRDGESRASATAMLATQASRAQRLAVADDVIANDGGPDQLVGRVEQLDRHYRTLAGGSDHRP